MLNSHLIPIGIALILIGFILVFVGTLLQSKGKTEAAFVGFIGPFPVGFGTSREILYVAVALSILLLLFLLINRVG